MGELETKYLSVRRRHRPRPLRDKPTAAIHSDVPISMSTRPFGSITSAIQCLALRPPKLSGCCSKHLTELTR